MGRMRVLRVYHGGRDPQHRRRERALVDAGVDVTLVVPSEWPDAGGEQALSPEAFRIVELPVRRAGDVNRHVYRDDAALRQLVRQVHPEVLDLHEEPFSLAARQWLQAAGTDVPVAMYTAQNIDKRLPPPFDRYERAAHERVAAFYACSRQAASVLRGKGFAGQIAILDIGYDDSVFWPGSQTLDCEGVVLALVGRLVPEKGVMDAVRVLARVNEVRPARLLLRGRGPDAIRASELAYSLGVADRLNIGPWQTADELAATYRTAHFVLIPSYPTETWAEQYGRVIVEAQACGAVVAGYASGAISEVAGDAGAIVPVGDVEQLSASITHLLSSKDRFDSRRAAGRRQVENCSWRMVAARQVALYADVLSGENVRLPLPASPRRRRAAARAEFGLTASTVRGQRPFALPVLRHGGPVSSIVAIICDAAAEFASQARSSPGIVRALLHKHR